MTLASAFVGYCPVHKGEGVCDKTDHHDWAGAPITHGRHFAPFGWSGRLQPRAGTRRRYCFHRVVAVHIRWRRAYAFDRAPALFVTYACGANTNRGVLSHHPRGDLEPCASGCFRAGSP